MQRGSSFGEIALLSNDGIRNLSVVCETDVVGARITRADFETSVRRIESRHLLKMLHFF
jgi:CRP-like cAMP-binding protein